MKGITPKTFERMRTWERMSLHIVELCDAHGITRETRRAGGRAWREPRRISIAPVRSSVTYAIALHEIGHVLSKRQRTRLHDEVVAWQWAQAHALFWDDRMDATRSRRLMSYVRWARRRQANDTRGRVFITDDHVCWRYINEDK